MISDNASTYEAAASELKNLFDIEVIATINRQGTTWQFILKNTPWFGGFWERLIKAAVKTLEEHMWAFKCYRQ